MSHRLYSTSPVGSLAILTGAIVVGATLQSGSGSGGGALAPNPPRQLEVENVTATSVALDWRRPSGGAEGYLVYRDGTPLATTGSSRYTDRDVAPFTTYTYWVTAWDDGEESERSDTVQVRTLDDTPPSPPADLVASLSAAPAVDLAWTPSEDAETGIAEYRVLRDGDEVGVSSTPAFKDAAIEGGRSYTYTVTAVNGQGLVSGPSNEASITTPDVTPPDRPDGVAAAAVGPDRIDVTWQASSDPESGVSFYRVVRGGAEIATTADTSYADTGLAPETTYSYRIVAVNGVGLESAPSDEASATTPESAEGPPPPTGLAAEASSPTQVRLSWTPPDVPAGEVAGYNVYRDGSFIGSTTASVYADIGLRPSTTYTYAVASVDDAGREGERSAEVAATTLNADGSIPPAPPTGLRVVTP